MPRSITRLAGLALLLVAVGCGSEDTDSSAVAPAEAVSPEPIADAEPSRTGGQETVAAMQGTWQARDDAQSVMQIDGDRVVESYGGQDETEATILAVRSCDDLTEDPASVYVVIEDADLTRCFEIDGVTETTLAYFNMARGNRLLFDRVAE